MKNLTTLGVVDLLCVSLLKQNQDNQAKFAEKKVLSQYGEQGFSSKGQLTSPAVESRCTPGLSAASRSHEVALTSARWSLLSLRSVHVSQTRLYTVISTEEP